MLSRKATLSASEPQYDVHDELLELEDELDDELGDDGEIARPLWRNIVHGLHFAGGAAIAGAAGCGAASMSSLSFSGLVEPAEWRRCSADSSCVEIHKHQRKRGNSRPLPCTDRRHSKPLAPCTRNPFQLTNRIRK